MMTRISKIILFYLIFNVMIVNAASIIVTIQKRRVIFDSCDMVRGQLRST